MNSGPVYDLRQDAVKQVQQARAQSNTSAAGKPLRTLKENANLQRTAQRKANRLQSGEMAGVIPGDFRTPLERAKDNDIGASDAIKVIEVIAFGAVSVFELMEAIQKDDAGKKALLDADVGYIGVGVGCGENSLWLVIELGQRPMEGAPELPEMDEFASFCDPTPGLLSLPGRTVQVSVE